MRLTVFGGGYVGLVAAICFADLGHEVTCIEADPDRVARVNAGVLPIVEAGLPEIFDRVRGSGRFRIAGMDEAERSVHASDVSFIAVGTPSTEQGIDFTALDGVSDTIGAALAGIERYHVVVVKSTVVPGTTIDRVLPRLEAASGRSLGEFGLAMNPEFLREGAAVSDFLEPDRVVVGAADDRSWSVLSDLYTFSDAPVVRMNPSTAEMVKYASNALLATMISFSNEMADVAATVEDVDIRGVMEGVHLDRRLTTRRQGLNITAAIATYLQAGCGYGGSCFPKDVLALQQFGSARGLPMPILTAVSDTNASRRAKLLELVTAALNGVEGKRIAVLGLAFKPGTDDIRESPAIPLVKALAAAGAEVRSHDPVAMHAARTGPLAGLPITYCERVSDALAGADAAVVVTSWPDYVSLSAADLLRAMRRPILIDGRGVFPSDAMIEAGVSYWALGRHHAAV